MANPTTIATDTIQYPSIVECGTAAATITLDNRKQYQLYHSGLNTSASSATTPICLSTDSSTDPAATTGTNKALLINGIGPIVIGPGLGTLQYLASANAPTFVINPIANTYGDY